MRKTKRRIVQKIIKKRRDASEKEQELIRLADEAQEKALLAEKKMLADLGIVIVEKVPEITEDTKVDGPKKGRPKNIVKEPAKEEKVDEQT